MAPLPKDGAGVGLDAKSKLDRDRRSAGWRL